MTAGPRPVLCLVTDRQRLRGGPSLAALEAQCREAIDAGIDFIQLREPDLDARDLLELTRRLAAAVRGTATRILVNDRADIAAIAGAGVHLKSGGPPAARVRSLFQAQPVISRSAHSTAEVLADPHVDIWLFGTVFPSRSKPAGSPVAGLQGLADAVAATMTPVLAIGGMTPDSAHACRTAGAAGIAAIEIFLPAGLSSGALGPSAAIRALQDRWQDPY